MAATINGQSIINSNPYFPATASNYTPANSQDDGGIVGQITYDTSYLYVKTANGWCRVSISSF